MGQEKQCSFARIGCSRTFSRFASAKTASKISFALASAFAEYGNTSAVNAGELREKATVCRSGVNRLCGESDGSEAACCGTDNVRREMVRLRQAEYGPVGSVILYGVHDAVR